MGHQSFWGHKACCVFKRFWPVRFFEQETQTLKDYEKEVSWTGRCRFWVQMVSINLLLWLYYSIITVGISEAFQMCTVTLCCFDLPVRVWHCTTPEFSWSSGAISRRLGFPVVIRLAPRFLRAGVEATCCKDQAAERLLSTLAARNPVIASLMTGQCFYHIHTCIPAPSKGCQWNPKGW